MSAPVIKLSYDKYGEFPLAVDQHGYVKWPTEPTTVETRSIHVFKFEDGSLVPRRFEILNVPKSEDQDNG